jgi:hypothetical protein
MEEGISKQVCKGIVEKVDGGIRRSKGFTNMVEEWIQYNIDRYVYIELCKYLRPVQHERRSNSMQLATDMAHARSRSRRARRTNQFRRALDAAEIHREDDCSREMALVWETLFRRNIAAEEDSGATQVKVVLK